MSSLSKYHLGTISLKNHICVAELGRNLCCIAPAWSLLLVLVQQERLFVLAAPIVQPILAYESWAAMQ
jgi:hypothetical protein